jgi:hypothetical protein
MNLKKTEKNNARSHVGMIVPLFLLLAASSCTPRLNHPRTAAITTSPAQILMNANSEGGGTPSVAHDGSGNPTLLLPASSIGGNYLKNVATGSQYKVRGGILNGP